MSTIIGALDAFVDIVADVTSAFVAWVAIAFKSTLVVVNRSDLCQQSIFNHLFFYIKSILGPNNNVRGMIM